MKVEIVDGELRVTVPLKRVVCALCDKSYEQVLAPGVSAYNLLTSPLQSFLTLPEFSKWKWVYPINDQVRHDPALICPDCALPIHEAERVRSDDVDAVTDALAKRILEKRKSK